MKKSCLRTYLYISNMGNFLKKCRSKYLRDRSVVKNQQTAPAAMLVYRFLSNFVSVFGKVCHFIMLGLT